MNNNWNNFTENGWDDKYCPNYIFHPSHSVMRMEYAKVGNYSNNFLLPEVLK